MNKYEELIKRAEHFNDMPIIGELINAVRELKDRENIVRCCEYVNYEFCKDGVDETKWSC